MRLTLADLTPPTLIGWSPGITEGTPLDGPDDPDVVRIKVLAGPDGIEVIAAAEEAELARRALVELGIPAEKIRCVICG
jgi:hypothetical protein